MARMTIEKIGQMVVEGFAQVKQALETFGIEMKGMKKDIFQLKGDVSQLKTDVSLLKLGQDEMQKDITMLLLGQDDILLRLDSKVNKIDMPGFGKHKRG